MLLLLTIRLEGISGCSDILVTPGASQDGSAMIAYNADDISLYGVLYHYPPTQGKQDEMVQVYDWDSGVSLYCISSSAMFMRRRNRAYTHLCFFLLETLGRDSSSQRDIQCGW